MAGAGNGRTESGSPSVYRVRGGSVSADANHVRPCQMRDETAGNAAPGPGGQFGPMMSAIVLRAGKMEAISVADRVPVREAGGGQAADN